MNQSFGPLIDIYDSIQNQSFKLTLAIASMHAHLRAVNEEAPDTVPEPTSPTVPAKRLAA